MFTNKYTYIAHKQHTYIQYIHACIHTYIHTGNSVVQGREARGHQARGGQAGDLEEAMEVTRCMYISIYVFYMYVCIYVCIYVLLFFIGFLKIKIAFSK